jgi:hypothetical protein
MPKYQAANNRRMDGFRRLFRARNDRVLPRVGSVTPTRASLCCRAHEPGGFNQVAARVPAASQVIVTLDGDNRWNGRVQCE